ncbi:unnamed protein product [Rhizoctonia solani]|nr:unnamed protein product [Rhizoctonia solani]
MSQQPLKTLPDLDQVDTSNVQGDIYPGFPKRNEDFLFFVIRDQAKFKQALKNPDFKPTTTADVFVLRQEIKDAKSRQAVGLVPMALMNIAFSRNGLNALGIAESLNQTDSDDPFEQGQLDNAERLGDPGQIGPGGFDPHWDQEFKSRIDGVFLVAGESIESVNGKVAKIQAIFGDSIGEVLRFSGAVRSGANKGHEHFGWYIFLDLPGIIICGHDGDPVSTTARPEWAREGSYLAFRKLKQLVPEFHQFLVENPVPEVLDCKHGSELQGARFFGRWPTGTPIQLAPSNDNPEIGKNPLLNNKFDYPGDMGDAGQTACPYSAHIRKTNPRSDLPLFKVARARLVRAGIPYGPELDENEKTKHTTEKDRGLAFVCYQSYLNDGFQFVQRLWANDATFVQGRDVKPGFDPIVGQNLGQPRGTMGTSKGFQAELPQDFVVSRGGEYFFSPSIQALKTRFVDT